MQQRPSFESLFRLSPNAYVLLDRDLVILDANAAYLALTGRRLEEIQGQRLHEAFAADPLSPETTRVQELLDSFARVLSRKAIDTLPVIRYSIARHTSLGSVYEDRYWSATHTPILDEQGEVVAILQHTSDITELQARAGGHYATVLTHIDDLVESMRVVTPIGISGSWRGSEPRRRSSCTR